jgi:hypothetical protein
MSATVMMKRIAEASPRFKARIAGALYLLLNAQKWNDLPSARRVSSAWMRLELFRAALS